MKRRNILSAVFTVSWAFLAMFAGAQSFQPIPGVRLTQISVGPHTVQGPVVWGVDAQHRVYWFSSAYGGISNRSLLLF